MKKSIVSLTLLVATVLLFSLPVHAAQKSQPKSPVETEVLAHEMPGDVHVRVNGLVCDFCARALEKVLSKEAAVKNIDVNLETKLITIYFNPDNRLTEDRITQLITNAGYSVVGIHYVK